MKKTLIILVIVIVAIGIATAIMKKPEKPKEPVGSGVGTSTIPLTQATSSETVATSTDTSDWKKYRNEKYGFELRYPANLSITHQTDESAGWRLSTTGEYDPPDLLLKVEKEKQKGIDLHSFVQEVSKRIQKEGIFVEINNKKVPAVELGSPQRTAFELEYVPRKSVDLVGGSIHEGIYFASNSAIISLLSGLESKTFSQIINSITLTK